MFAHIPLAKKVPWYYSTGD